MMRGDAKDYETYSYWLESSGDDLTARPSLDGSIDVDVAILGAGYSGLWTAYYLLCRQPGIRVAVLEKEIAGFGASGRNGGWCYAGYPLTLGEMERRYGAEGARAVQLAMNETVDEVARVCREEGIECDYHKGGYLRIARGKYQLPIIQAAYQTIERLGLANHYRLLSALETENLVHATDIYGGLFGSEGASIHPGKLVRGLARAVERRGGTIYERTEVTDFRGEGAPALVTRCGEVRASTIVLAGEAYLSRLPTLHRQVTPVYSLISLTEALTPEQSEAIGWRNRELVSSNKLTVDYLNRTADGRVLFGSRGAPYHFGSRIEDEYDRHAAIHRWIKRLAVEWFPALGDVQFTHSWGGPVGMPRDFTPTIRYDRAEGIATARGYVGQGVSTTNLAGRILADLITDAPSPISELPIVGHRSRNWEPEPLRWMGMRYIQRALARVDSRAERTGKTPTGTSLPERLMRH